MAQALKSVAIATAHGLGLLAGSIMFFAIAASVIYRLSHTPRHGCGLKEGLSYAFPKEAWMTPRTKTNWKLFVINTFITGPIAGLVVTLTSSEGVAHLLTSQ